MSAKQEMRPERIYLIRKKIIGVNELDTKSDSWQKERFQKNLNRFILPFAELLSFSFTNEEVLMVIRTHPEEIIRKLPKYVEDQKYELTASDLPLYLSGELGSIHNSKHNCAELDPCWVIRKKVSNFLHSFTIFFNRKNDRPDRLFRRKTWIEELDTDELVARKVVEVETEPIRQGDEREPEECGNTLKETLQGEMKRVSIPRLRALFGSDLSMLRARVLSEVKILKEILDIRKTSSLLS